MSFFVDFRLRLVVRHLMLRSFVGTFDELGLRSLVTESDDAQYNEPDGPQSFWAVLDHAELHSIHRAFEMGERQTALEMVFNSARSVGRLIKP